MSMQLTSRTIYSFLVINVVAFFLTLALPPWVPSATAEEQAYLGDYGIIMVNDQPFFPIGLYHDSMDAGRYGLPLLDDLNTIAGSGSFNTMIVSLDPTYGQTVTDFYLAAAQKNIKVISQVYLPALSLEVSAYVGMPQLFGIGIGDDFNSPPSDPKYSPATMLSRTNTVKSINPHFLTFGAAGGHKVFPIAPYVGTMDIVGVECYPLGDGNQSYANELEATDDYFQYNRAMMDPYTTEIAILQGFPRSDGSRWPTAAEARNQAWIAMIRGIQGVVWYSYYTGSGRFITQNSELWNEVGALSTDLKNFSAVVLNAFSTRKEQHYAGDQAFANDSGGWHAATWQYNGATYVVVANTHRTQSQSVTINLPSGATGKVQPMFSTSRYGSGFSRLGTQLSGTIAAGDVHVYQIDGIGDPTPTPSPTPTSTPRPTATPMPTPTPKSKKRLHVTISLSSTTATLSQVSGRSIITCTVKDDAGRPVVSQTVSVEKAAAVEGPYTTWVSKKTNVKGQGLYPYAQAKNNWYMRCSTAGYVSVSKMIKGYAATAAR